MVKNKHIIIKKLIYYGILQYLVMGAIFAFMYTPIFEWCCLSLKLRENSSLYPLIQYGLMAFLAAFWIYLFFTKIRSQRYKYLTGRSYAKDHHQYNKTYTELVEFWEKSDPYKIDIEKQLPVEDWHTAEGVILGKAKDKFGTYHLLKRDSAAPGNLICFGRPGCGKSTTQAATTAARFNADRTDGGCGVFAISIKGDLLNFVKDKRKNIKVFTPDNAVGSCHYDPFSGLSEMSLIDKRTFAENMSQIICPDEDGENAAFFVEGARDYFCSILLYLCFMHETGKISGPLRFPEFVDEILNDNVFNITMTIKASGCRIAGEYTNSYEGSSEKNVSGIYKHLVKNIRPFHTGALAELLDGKGDCITPDDLNSSDIYIDVPQDKYSVYAPVISIIISNFLQAFMRRPDVSSGEETVPILFLLDEAVQLKLPFQILDSAMSTLRSKKVTLFLLMQSIAQLEAKYGDVQAREIIDLCSYISVFNAQDPKSREFFHKLIGTRKMLKSSTSLSSKSEYDKTAGESVTVEEECIFKAADFGDLNVTDKKGNVTHHVLIYAEGKYLLCETTPCYQ